MDSPRANSEQTVHNGFGGGHNRDQHVPREVLDPTEVAPPLPARSTRRRASALARAWCSGTPTGRLWPSPALTW
jgi:hypothetical protein